MRIEMITCTGKEFAVIPLRELQKLMDDAEMLADAKAYDAAKARLEHAADELIPLEITERRLKGETRRLRPIARPGLSAHGRSWALRST